MSFQYTAVFTFSEPLSHGDLQNLRDSLRATATQEADGEVFEPQDSDTLVLEDITFRMS